MHRDEVYRDPETGQFVAVDDDEPVELTYADHEFVNFNLDELNQAGGTSRAFSEYKIEDDVLDLENDELGMLAWMTARLTVVSDFNPDNDDAGSIEVLATIGSNLAGSEYLNDPGQAGGVEVLNSTNNTSAGGEANDEPGTWAILAATANPAFFQSTSEDSGGGTNGRDRMTRKFYDETRGGPYIDSTDDITAAISATKQRSDDNIRINVAAQLAFVVFEYEHRRAEFAPYDPGPGV